MDLSEDQSARAKTALDLVRWILTEGRLEAAGEDPVRAPGSPTRFMNSLCRRIVAAGVPLCRATVYAATLHPQLRGFGWRWWREGRIAEEVRIAQGTELTEEFKQSPLRGPIEQGVVLRRRLDTTQDEFPFLEEMHAAGATEYLAVPLNRANRRYPVAAWTTDRAGGFTGSDIALLEEIRPALAAIVEMIVSRRTARGLFDIYLDRHVGERLLDGHIQRGHTEPLRAVVMATDLRGFTSLSDHLPGEQVIELLDDYFEVVASRVHAHDGNVLKFIGDGVLAIFRTDSAHNDRTAARAALTATHEILEGLRGCTVEGQSLRAGIGLHIGTVMYGNVGSADRLDFTVIGPATNMAFRLEALTKQLGRPVLASHAFADAVDMPLVSLGKQPIRGFQDIEEVFGLPEHGVAAAGTPTAPSA